MIVAGSGPRAVATTASYEARLFGVGSGMPAAQALRLCPQAIVIPPNSAAYREVSRQVMAVIRNHIARVEQLGIDEAFLDLEGLHSPKSAMRRLVVDIYQQTSMRAQENTQALTKYYGNVRQILQSLGYLACLGEYHRHSQMTPSDLYRRRP